jgi:tRNA(Arg) A34 adenosine deaminase TadA
MRRTDTEMLLVAAGAGLRKADLRAFRLGAVGVRNDGTLVSASNGPAPYPHPDAHAEARLCMKLTPGSEIWVARVRKDGTLGIARPCPRCMVRLRSAGVTRVAYTISDVEHGVLRLDRDHEVQRPMRGSRG